MVTGRVVLLLVTLAQGLDRDSGHHPGHVNVGQTIGELVHIDMDAVDAVLRLHLSLEPGLSGSEINTNKTSFKCLKACAYSCRESRKTLLVYSSNSEVLESRRASLLGLLKANAVPMEDFELAPMSRIKFSYKMFLQ